MKLLNALLNEKYARKAAVVLQWACYVVMAFFVLTLVLACLGRQTFALNTGTDFYENAIYAGQDHEWRSRGFTVYSGDDILVTANDGDQIDLTTHIGLSLMFAAQSLPTLAMYWLLSRVFANVAQGNVFTGQNARYLLGYGLLQLFLAVCLPFLKLLICHLTNLVSGSRIALSTGAGMLDSLFTGIAFIVAAYILQYGIALQDEVDHTL